MSLAVQCLFYAWKESRTNQECMEYHLHHQLNIGILLLALWLWLHIHISMHGYVLLIESQQVLPAVISVAKVIARFGSVYVWSQPLNQRLSLAQVASTVTTWGCLATLVPAPAWREWLMASNASSATEALRSSKLQQSGPESESLCDWGKFKPRVSWSPIWIWWTGCANVFPHRRLKCSWLAGIGMGGATR